MPRGLGVRVPPLARLCEKQVIIEVLTLENPSLESFPLNGIFIKTKPTVHETFTERMLYVTALPHNSSMVPETWEKCAIVIIKLFGDGKVGTNKSKEKFLQDVLRLLYEQQERISKLEQGLHKLRNTDKAKEIPAHIQEILPNEPHNVSMN